jgi:riboflavin synthase
MFTGIIEGVGSIKEIERDEDHARLVVSVEKDLLSDAHLGDSISVNGVCLTAVELEENTVSFDAVYETMRRSSLGYLAVGDQVNIERAMKADSRFGGHMVQGHVDAVGTIASIRQHDNSFSIFIDVPRDLMRYIVSKGSISVDGISLTVVDADDRTFSVAIIPHTWEHTNLSERVAGDAVNIETDIVGKYIERIVSGSADAYRAKHISDSFGKISNDDYSLDDPLLKITATETDSRQ